MKTGIVIGSILLLWLVLAQSCMTFRKTDRQARREFSEKGLSLTTTTLAVKGYRLHYVQTGSDMLPTIVFVHGSPGSWDAFQHYLEDSDLLRKFRLVAIDRPGFGHSNYGHAMNLGEQSAIISPLFDHIKNGRPVFLVGHSLGGPMVIKLGADNPGKIAGIVLLAGANDPGQEKPEKWRPVLFETPLNYFVPGAMRPSNEELWYLKSDLVALKADFPKIDCPVYIVHGLKDDMVPPANVAYDKKMLIHAARVEELLLPDANHFIPWTRFEPIKRLLLRLY